MQKKLLNISLLSLGFIFALHSCIRVKKASSEGLNDSDKEYLVKIERQFQNDSLTKIEYAVKKVNFLCEKREYKLAYEFFKDLDSLDTAYFKYPIEKRIRLGSMLILSFNKDNEIRKRDSSARYIIDIINEEKYKSRIVKATQENVDYDNYLSRMKWNVRNMLLYENLDIDEKGNIKKIINNN